MSISWLVSGRNSCSEDMNNAKRAENGNIARTSTLEQDQKGDEER